MKALIALVAACACIAVAGCGGSDSTATGAAESGSADAPLGPKPKVPQGPSSQKLIVKDLRKGSGAVVKKGDRVAVHYVAGIYETGKEIESAWVEGDPLGLQLSPGNVLPAWERGLPGMRVGGRRELIFPTTIKHTPIGSSPKDTLVYVVEVVAIE